MKKILLLGLLAVSSAVLAQESKPNLDQEGMLVKATYLYEDGSIQQEGFFKDGKLDGKWVSYDMSGNKKSMGEYNNGTKTGKWFFWNGNTLSEVDYSRSRIASVKNWKQENLVNRD